MLLAWLDFSDMFSFLYIAVIFGGIFLLTEYAKHLKSFNYSEKSCTEKSCTENDSTENNSTKSLVTSTPCDTDSCSSSYSYTSSCTNSQKEKRTIIRIDQENYCKTIDSMKDLCKSLSNSDLSKANCLLKNVQKQSKEVLKILSD